MRAQAIFLVLILLATGARAGDLYKWQDENGIWHFSDRPPRTDDQQYEAVALPAEPRPMVSMRKAGSRHEPEHHFFNHYGGPAELEVRLNVAENIRSDPALPARILLPGQQERKVVTLKAADPSLGFRYQLAYSLVPGPAVADLPADLDYYPPFPSGHDYPVSQGFGGGQTHHDEANRYAVDIVMPTGTPILAARTGIVMDVEDDFHGGEQSPRFLERANRVRLLHDDGSMTVYAHLEPNSARVYPGTRVPAGAWIANSGNTGYSSGPHLHFVVQVNTGQALTSIPFRFRQPAGATLSPEGGERLRGVLASP